MLDTPGFVNFIQEARGALRVADAAVIVVDAVSGVMVQTEKYGALRRNSVSPGWLSSTEWTAIRPALSAHWNRFNNSWAGCALLFRFPSARNDRSRALSILSP